MSRMTSIDSARSSGTALRGLILVTMIVAGLVVIALPSVRADTKQSQIAVGVRVQPVATLKTLSAPRVMVITQKDLDSGVLELPAAQQLEIHSNSREGYVLNVRPLSNVFTRVEVLGVAGIAEIGSEGGAIVQRWQGPNTATMSVGYRIHLVPGLSPGTYPWPLQLAVAPL